MQRSFSRKLDSLDGIFSFAWEFENEKGLNDSLSYFLTLVLEELFTTLIRHSPGEGEIDILVDLGQRSLTITLKDAHAGGDFDDLFKEPDPKTPLYERQPGVLGIKLVKKMADELEYDFTDGTLTVTAKKHLEDS